LTLLCLESVQLLAKGIAYIAMFGAGSIAGMALLSVEIAIPMRLTVARYLAWLHNAITASDGTLSCVLDSVMIYRIAFASFRPKKLSNALLLLNQC